MSSQFTRTSGSVVTPEGLPEPELPAMAEVDLLPKWYPVLLRRRRRLLVQAWLTGVLVVVLVAVLVWRRANEEATHVELASLEEQRRMTDAQLTELTIEEARLEGLLGRARLVSRMGLPLEVTRVMGYIDEAIPADVALTSVEVMTEEQPGSFRRMTFRLAGYAETSRSATDLSAELQKQPLLRDVRLAGTSTTHVYNRPVMVFEISFFVNISAGGGAFAEVKGEV